ncbi:MAG: fasciclin domain-containing protein [Ginsengibacter sp.]
MKKIFNLLLIATACFFISCNTATETDANNSAETASTDMKGQSGVQDEDSDRNVVQVAISSPDHTTLVKAVQAAELVDALSNAGPFTVFAPTNAAFDLLPAGTVANLLKPASKDDLVDILQYHVIVGVYNAESFTDGQEIGQVNGNNVTMSVKDGKVMINGKATIIASIPAANGVVHVIDAVLLPPTK